jgi:FAD dependent oxidoreductase
MRLTRRELFAGALCLPSAIAGAREFACDVAVIGGSFGGCAAALAAARNGMRVVMTEECPWIGGQVTSQAVPPDEHPWIEQFGCTRSYRDFRDGVRDYYRRHYPLTEAARAKPNLNPGDGSVSRLTHEPRVALAVLKEMLAPHVSSGRLTILNGYRSSAVDADRDRIRAVTVEGGGSSKTVHAQYFLDATEQGDLLPLARAEYVIGAESRAETGEAHAAETARRDNIQSFTFCFAIDYLPGEDHTIDKPEEYSFWRDYVPDLHPPWPGKLLSWSMADPVTLKERKVYFDPTPVPHPGGGLNLWLYRRIANRQNFTPGAYASDISLVNWPQNDYWLGPICDVAPDVTAKNLRGGRQLSLSLLYWMQTEQGWKGLRLRPDIVGTEDGLAQYPYVRESRRIRAEFTVREQDVGSAFADSVGIGSYRIDLHPSTARDNYIDVSSLPFQIPLGALIPRRVENLLPACKNLGVTHITNGCYRLHPVEWNTGEAAGMLAAYAVSAKQLPRQVHRSEKLLKEFQARLQGQGVEIAWPKIGAR